MAIWADPHTAPHRLGLGLREMLGIVEIRPIPRLPAALLRSLGLLRPDNHQPGVTPPILGVAAIGDQLAGLQILGGHRLARYQLGIRSRLEAVDLHFQMPVGQFLNSTAHLSLRVTFLASLVETAATSDFTTK